MPRTAVAVLCTIVAGGLLTACGTQEVSEAPVTVSNSVGYNDIAAALRAGRDVEVTTDIAQCTTPTGTATPAVTGGLHIATFQILPDKTIAFSDTHPSLTAQNTRLTEFIRYRLTPDGAMTLTTTALDATDKVLGTAEYDCHLGKGAYFHWS